MIETRSQKASKDKRTTLKVEIHRSAAQEQDPAEHETEGSGTRRLTSESNPIKSGNDFASLTRTLDLEKLSEMSDISIEKPAVEGSTTDHTMMRGVSGKAWPRPLRSQSKLKMLWEMSSCLPWEQELLKRSTLS